MHRSLWVAILCVTWLLLRVGPAAAEGPGFADRVTFGTGVSASTSVALGDVNDDGALDVMVGNDRGQSLVYLNDGMGRFYDGAQRDCSSLLEQLRCFGEASDRVRALAVADLNGDGSLDIVVLSNGGQSKVYFNDGAGAFGESRAFGSTSTDALDLAIGDVNGDASFDLVVAGPRQNLIYLNDGAGHFDFGRMPDCAALPENVRCFGDGTTETVALGDMNGDGSLDIIVGSSADARTGQQGAVYLNDGAGRYAANAPTQCAQTGEVRCFGPAAPNAAIRALTVANPDNDGDFDIAAAYADGEVILYANDGSGAFPSSSVVATAPARLASAADMADEDFEAAAVQPEEFKQTLTFADVNGDGVLDLVHTRSQQQSVVYLNDSAGGFASSEDAIPFGTANDATYDMAVGDMNGDAALDLAAVNLDQRNAIYLNDGAGSMTDMTTLGSTSDRTYAVALGDYDGDGSLDLAVANFRAPIRLYVQTPAVGFNEDQSFGSGGTLTLAAGDVNNDGNVDILAGVKDQPIALYVNEGGGRFGATPLAFGLPNAWALALADVNGDGFLDVVAGFDAAGDGAQSSVYLNDGQGRFDAAEASRPLGADKHHTRAVAVGDVDGDGDPDVVTGNYGSVRGEVNRLFLNDGAGRFDGPGSEWQLPGDPDNTTSVGLGDLNGDGTLDLVVGNDGRAGKQNYVYFNAGDGYFTSGELLGSGRVGTRSLQIHDINGDGALDVVAGHMQGRNVVYVNDSSGNFPAAREFGPEIGGSHGLTMGDIDRDGDPDIVSGGPLQGVAITWNHLRQPRGLGNQPGQVSGVQPSAATLAGPPPSATVYDQQKIPISYTLFDSEGDPARGVELFYSVDGGGYWQKAAAPAETVATNPVTNTAPAGGETGTHTYIWDTFASGFFEQSDNVVLRLVAYPGQRARAHGLPDTQQWPYAASASVPIRVRGTQVRVFRESNDEANAAGGAMVYRLPDGLIAGAQPLGSEGGRVFRTNASGYLEGGGELAPGDRLAALLPVAQGPGVTLYHTSATPTSTGLRWYTVDSPGIQQLVVSKTNPLYLFDLDVSLEWDASNDDPFLDELTQAINRASEILYDATDGQMALGDVRIHQAKEYWTQADVIVYANNSIRPTAAMGGLVNLPRNDIEPNGDTIPSAYVPGQIRMGPLWDPYGQNRAEMSQDWSRALAHEFGHYLLFLDDNYLGYNSADSVVSVDCKGSFMTTAYDDKYSEFLTTTQWQKDPDCLSTIAQNQTGRSDWATIKKFYNAVDDGGSNPGPSVLPLGITRVSLAASSGDAPDATLPARFYDLRDWDNNGVRLVVAQGLAYLIQTRHTSDLSDDGLIALGTTGRSDRIKVRGAVPGDTMCVFETEANPARMGCTAVTARASAIRLRAVPGWRPNILVTATEIPVTDAADPTAATSQPALAITVIQPGETGGINAQVFSASARPGAQTSPWAPLISAGGDHSDTYTATIPLAEPVFSGYVRVWVSDTVKSAVSQFSLTANCDPKASGAWRFANSCSPDAAGGKDGSSDLTDTSGVTIRSLGDSEGVGAMSGNVQSGGGDVRGSGGGDVRGSGGGDVRGSGGGDVRGSGGGDVRGSGGGDVRGSGGGDVRGSGGGDVRGSGGANYRAMAAPIASATGQVTIYLNRGVEGDAGIQSLQALPSVPGLPEWLTTVGQGYRFVVKRAVDRTIAMNYLQRDVPDGYEYTLRLYYSPDEGKTWRRLPNPPNMQENLITGPAIESGLYVLVASVDIPIYAKGWNLLAYPVPETRGIADALQSIAGSYTTVVGFDRSDMSDPWKVYDPDAPSWVNDLGEMSFGNGYWINASQPITLQLQTPSLLAAPQAQPAVSLGLTDALNRRNPPAVYYGTVSDTTGNILPGTPVTALIDGDVCGQGRTVAGEAGEDARYIVKVLAADADATGCGAPERSVTFQIGDQIMAPSVTWDNVRPHEQNLTPASGSQ